MNLKKLKEDYAKALSEMKKMTETIKTEERAFTEDEIKAFDELESQAEALRATIERIKAMKDAEETETDDPEDKGDERATEERSEGTETIERRSFEAYIRGAAFETRDDEPTPINMTKGDNGAVIPTSIANKIIEKVKEISPIFNDSERYNVKGTLTIPYYSEATDSIQMEYADEFSDGVSHSGKILNITLTGFLGRAITDVSKSLINNSQFDIVSYVVNKMAEAIAAFIEKELLFGTENKIEGIAAGITQEVTSKSNTEISGDNLIDLQESIPDAYQGNAYFIMNRKTRAAIRKIKTGEGEYILNRDFNSRWGYTLLGKDVYTSDAMPEVKAANAGKYAVYYGDMTGLAVKVSEDINIEVLREVKAQQHAVEVLGFVELDAKVQNSEKIAAIKVHA